jgi:hypothetical protein
LLSQLRARPIAQSRDLRHVPRALFTSYANFACLRSHLVFVARRRCMHRSLLIRIQSRSAVFEIYEQVWQPCDALFVYTNGPSFCSQVYFGTYHKLLVTCWPDVPRVAEALTNVSSTSRNSRGFGKASERPDLDKRVFRHRCGDVRLSRMLSPSQQLARSRLKAE